jgi:hypothetical protein
VQQALWSLLCGSNLEGSKETAKRCVGSQIEAEEATTQECDCSERIASKHTSHAPRNYHSARLTVDIWTFQRRRPSCCITCYTHRGCDVSPLGGDTLQHRYCQQLCLWGIVFLFHYYFCLSRWHCWVADTLCSRNCSVGLVTRLPSDVQTVAFDSSHSVMLYRYNSTLGKLMIVILW